MRRLLVPLLALLALSAALFGALLAAQTGVAAPAEPVSGACRVIVEVNGAARSIIKPDAFCVSAAVVAQPTATTAATTAATRTPAPTRTPTATPPATVVGQAKWQITVYYTAVESYHTDANVAVKGCPTIQGGNCGQALGSWPKSFVQAVKDEGTGRLNDGRYLNWSYDTGYWLDTAPRGSYGNVLVPFQSSAADGVQKGTAFRVTGCGKDSGSGDPIDAQWCDQLKAASWIMDDEFTPGLGGQRHVDLYIGEEDRANFVRQSPKVIDTSGATLSIP